MRGVAEEKIAGGKLLRIKVDFDTTVEKAQISGDFFLHPEEAIKDVEKCLFGITAEMEESGISRLLEEVMKSQNIEMIGISPQDIARVLKKAIMNAK